MKVTKIVGKFDNPKHPDCPYLYITSYERPPSSANAFNATDLYSAEEAFKYINAWDIELSVVEVAFDYTETKL
jgi:hypothetical protein